MKFGDFEKNTIRRIEAGDYEAGFLGKINTEEKSYKEALEKIKEPPRKSQKLKILC